MFKRTEALAFLWVSLALILCSCAKEPVVVEKASQAAKNSITALERSLSQECATESIKAQLEGIKMQITSIEAACDTEKAALVAAERDKKRKWQLAFAGLVSLILAFFVFQRIQKPGSIV